MKVRIFQSGKGDCLLVTSSNGKTNILVDGGVPEAYEKHFAGALASLRKKRRKLDAVYVSHIDRDHIGGVLKMLDNEVAWRVFGHRKRQNLRRNPRPKVPRPCDIKSIWHNAFFEEANLNKPSVVNTLTHTGAALSAHPSSDVLRLAEHIGELGLSVGDAIEVSRRIGKKQLGIPLNPQFRGKFMLRKKRPKTIRIGTIRARILGPTPEAMKGLIKEWNQWLDDKSGHLARLIRRHERDAGRLVNSALEDILEMLTGRAEDLAADRKQVTPPNLASLMFLFEDSGKRALFTGDGAWEDVIAGLKAHRLLDSDGNLHVDLLKVPHHGAHNSFSDEFARRVTADHYLFCGNGKHHNPEPDVVQGYIRARRGKESERTTNRQANRTFKLWFNCSQGEAEPKLRKFWEDLERDVAKAAQKTIQPRMQFRFLTGNSMTKTL